MSERIQNLLHFGLFLLALSGCSTPRLQQSEGHITVPGGRVWYRVVGSGPGTPLLILHGGPGMPSHPLERLARLGDERPVIFYDQLGCGRSERPSDTNLWRVERFVEELRCVRSALGLKRVHILGQSWGTMLATDYMLSRPAGVSSLILSSPCLSAPRFGRDATDLRMQLPQDIQDVLTRHEAAGTTDSPEYEQAGMVFLKRHVCRMEPWPVEITNALSGFGKQVYNTMWGPSEFHAAGLLKDYDRTPRLGELRLPVLFTAGRFDECTPAATAWYQSLVPDSRLEIFEQSAHIPLLEEEERYLAVVRRFLQQVERRRSSYKQCRPTRSLERTAAPLCRSSVAGFGGVLCLSRVTGIITAGRLSLVGGNRTHL